MISKIEKILSTINEKKIKFIDLRFTDIHGKEQHITISSKQINNTLFQSGKIFDGSSLDGWKNIHESDMILMPDPNYFIIDPFYKEKTIILKCDIIEPKTMENYSRDPRSIAKRAEKFLKISEIADIAFFGPEPEFFIFDNIYFKTETAGSKIFIDDIEATWNSDKIYQNGNKGHRPKIKRGYAPLPPVDSSHNLRSTMSSFMEKMGLNVESHHHEVAHTGQNEITTQFSTLTKKADEIQIYKYVVHNVAHIFNKTATFMPKPIVGDNGSGMHCHISLSKNKKNIFFGKKYARLSEIALFYIGGILQHAKSLNAITNPTTNSYKRLTPGYEAPTLLTYSSSNRSSAIRIPTTTNNDPQLSSRIEVRFPDPSANPYLAFSALLMAGLDGIINKIHPGEATDIDLYTLSENETYTIPKIANSLEEALNALHHDHKFLTRGGVFTEDSIQSFITLKKQENTQVSTTPHPIEFELYYSV